MKLLLLLLFIPYFFINAQTGFNAESFNVTRSDLETNVYEKDTTANALVIYEYGKSYVHKEKYNLRTQEKYKIKILNQEGFKAANITIYLYQNKDSKELINNLTATTYNLIDGKVTSTKLGDDAIFREKHNDNYTLVKFTLPNIKEGSVISYSYTRISPFMFKYKGWNFQSDIPKLYSEYNTSIPANWEYNIKLVGKKKLFKHDQDVKQNCLKGSNGAYAGCAISTYAMKDIPAFIDEDYMTSEYNYLARIEYELKTFKSFSGDINHYTKTWKAVDKEIENDKEIGRQLTKAIKKEELLDTSIIDELDPLKKAEGIYEFVKANYTWNNVYKIFTEASIKDLLKEKSGNVSSINILLHNLLKASGIEVKPVLCSTRNNGFPTKIYPVLSDFNYLIVQATIDGKSYLLDATDKYLSFGELPFRCLNQYGRLFDFKNGSQWIDIKAKDLSSIAYKIQLNIDDNEQLTGTIESKKTGHYALNSRKSYFSNQETYIKNLEDKSPYIEINNYSVSKLQEKSSSSFLESYDIAYNANKTSENIYINPFLTKVYKENPFKLQERTYPIDFGYKKTFLYIINLNFNDAYTLIEKPKNAIYALPNKKGRVSLSTTVLENSISIFMKLDFKSAIYEPEYYPYLKEFMNKIIDIQNNSLILLKKK